MNPDEAELHLKNRGICETKHAQIKNIVKFDVKGYRADSRELYTLMNFVTVQCEFLAHLQNGSQNKSLAGLI